MPARCKAYLCPNPRESNGYCASHQHLFVERRPFQRFEYNDIAAPHYATSQWRRFSRAYLKEHPTCSICGKKAEVTDHFGLTAVQMVQRFGGFIYDPSFYRALCKYHNLATRNQRMKKPKRDL